MDSYEQQHNYLVNSSMEHQASVVPFQHNLMGRQQEVIPRTRPLQEDAQDSVADEETQRTWHVSQGGGAAMQQAGYGQTDYGGQWPATGLRHPDDPNLQWWPQDLTRWYEPAPRYIPAGCSDVDMGCLATGTASTGLATQGLETAVGMLALGRPRAAATAAAADAADADAVNKVLAHVTGVLPAPHAPWEDQLWWFGQLVGRARLADVWVVVSLPDAGPAPAPHVRANLGRLRDACVELARRLAGRRVLVHQRVTGVCADPPHALTPFAWAPFGEMSVTAGNDIYVDCYRFAYS